MGALLQGELLDGVLDATCQEVFQLFLPVVSAGVTPTTAARAFKALREHLRCSSTDNELAPLLTLATALAPHVQDSSLDTSTSSGVQQEFGTALEYVPSSEWKPPSPPPSFLNAHSSPEFAATALQQLSLAAPAEKEAVSSSSSSSTSAPGASRARKGRRGDPIDSNWLRRCCEQLFGSGAAPALCVAIFDLLRSQHSADRLQGELFDLLGDKCAHCAPLSADWCHLRWAGVQHKCPCSHHLQVRSGSNSSASFWNAAKRLLTSLRTLRSGARTCGCVFWVVFSVGLHAAACISTLPVNTYLSHSLFLFRFAEPGRQRGRKAPTLTGVVVQSVAEKKAAKAQLKEDRARCVFVHACVLVSVLALTRLLV